MSNLLKIPIKKLNDSISTPEYAYAGDAGFDLMCTEELSIGPQERKLAKCGFSIAIPDGYAGLIIPRSGLALNHGISVVNAPGLIDSGYRGEICVILLNTDKLNTFKCDANSRIAQMMIIPYANAVLQKVEVLDDGSRGSKGFGSSGSN